MKNKYISPSTRVVSVIVKKHLLEYSNMQIQQGNKTFGSTLSREGGSSWDDDDE